MNKGQMMKLIYTPQELGHVDSAIPIELWKDIDTSEYVMDYTENRVFGILTKLEDKAKERNIKLN